MSMWPAVIAAAETKDWVSMQPGQGVKPPESFKGEPVDAAEFYGRMADEGRRMLWAREQLGDFEPKPEQTFWQWVFGRKP